MSLTGATGAGIMKAVYAGSAGGSALALAVAASLGEIPSDGHTVVELVSLLSLSAVAYIWTQIRAMNKQSAQQQAPVQIPHEPHPHQESGSGEHWRENLMQKLEDMAYGTRESGKELKEHRIEFSRFAGRTEARLDGLDERMSRIEKGGDA